MISYPAEFSVMANCDWNSDDEPVEYFTGNVVSASELLDFTENLKSLAGSNAKYYRMKTAGQTYIEARTGRRMQAMARIAVLDVDATDAPIDAELHYVC
jgi:hypothetical protein